MTSLQYLSCTTTIPSSHPRTSSSRLVFPKQSHFIPHAKHCHHLQVSCQNQNNSDGKMVDRRNMLFGLGGLYGAANLISTPGQASADPIAAPELDKCRPATNWSTGEPLDESCCLEKSAEIIDYELPSRFPMRHRRPAHLFTTSQIEDYKEAIRRMKNLPDTHAHSFTQQSRIHCAYCNAAYYQPDTNNVNLQVHHNWLFFPFHRWYLYFFEKICGKLIEKPDFALPYWNWDHPDGMYVPPMFLDTNSPLHDNLRDLDTASDNPTVPVFLGGDSTVPPAQMIQNNIAQVRNEMMTIRSNPTEFMGAEIRKGQVVDGEGASESGSHNSVHGWIGTKPHKNPINNPNGTGENMGNFYSAGRDPLFYSHHANVDRMWVVWLGLPGRYSKTIEKCDYLNTQFIFYDENERLVRVKVEDCVGSTLRMGYAYEYRETPWETFTPQRQTAQARTKRASFKAEKAETVVPLTLERVARVQVSKTQKGKADEYLVIENITYDTKKFVKFDVFVNDEDDDLSSIQKASYAGTFSQVPTKSSNDSATSSIRLRLTELYDYMDVDDDDSVLVTLVPRHEGPGISIGGIRIIENPYI